MNKFDAIAVELAIGPVTAPELAAIMGESPRLICSRLCAMEATGEVCVFGMLPGPAGGSKIYELTRKGRKRAARFSGTVHTGSVNRGETVSGTRAVSMISGAKTTNKTLKPMPPAPFAIGQFGVLQTHSEETLVRLSETGVR